MKKAALFCLGFSALLLAYQYPLQLDLTRPGYYQLSTHTQSLLKTIQEPLHIELLSPDPDVQRMVQATVVLFQQYNRQIQFQIATNFAKPDLQKRFDLKKHHHLKIQSPHQTQVFDLDLNRWGEQYLSQHIYEVLRDTVQGTLLLDPLLGQRDAPLVRPILKLSPIAHQTAHVAFPYGLPCLYVLLAWGMRRTRDRYRGSSTAR